MASVDSADADNLTGFICANIEKGSKVITDGWSGYSKVKNEGYDHIVEKVSKYSDALPHVHLVISLVKRWILGSLHGGISRKQLEYYLDEFVFRFNRRKSKDRQLIFHRLIETSVKVGPKPFKLITGSNEEDTD